MIAELFGKRPGRSGVIIFDGATATALGAGRTAPVSLMNLEARDRVLALHVAYLAAGSRIIQTNSFDAGRLALTSYGLQDRTVEFNRAAVAIARQARERFGPCFIGGNIGPCPPASRRELIKNYAEQAALLSGADFIHIETMTSLEHALVALRGAREGSQLPVAVSLVFARRGDRLATVDGAGPADAARALAEAGARAVGSNCGATFQDVLDAIREMRRAVSLPLVARPSAGLPERRPEGLRYPVSAKEFGELCRGLIAAGAGIIGGCCGTDPSYIAALVRAVAARRPVERSAPRRSSRGSR